MFFAIIATGSRTFCSLLSPGQSDASVEAIKFERT